MAVAPPAQFDLYFTASRSNPRHVIVMGDGPSGEAVFYRFDTPPVSEGANARTTVRPDRIWLVSQLYLDSCHKRYTSEIAPTPSSRSQHRRDAPRSSSRSWTCP